MRVNVKTSLRNSGSTFQLGVSGLCLAASRAVRAPSGGGESPPNPPRRRYWAKLTPPARSSNNRQACSVRRFIVVGFPVVWLETPPAWPAASPPSSSPARADVLRGSAVLLPAPAIDAVWRLGRRFRATAAPVDNARRPGRADRAGAWSCRR